MSSDNKLNKQNNDKISSASSIDTQNGAGIIDAIFGTGANNYTTMLVLDAFRNKLVPAGVFIINHALDNGIKLKFHKIDCDGKTILHWVVYYSAYFSPVKELLVKLLQLPYVTRCINIQDKNKNTIAHYAVRLEMFDIVNLLVKKGIDLTIPNDQGMTIEEKTAMVEKEQNPSDINIFIKKTISEQHTERLPDLPDISDFRKLREQLQQKIAMITDKFVPKTDTETINFNRNETEEQNELPNLEQQDIKNLEELVDKLNSEKAEDDVAKILQSTNKTSNAVQGVMKDHKQKDNIIMMGGAQIHGTRKMVTYSEINKKVL